MQLVLQVNQIFIGIAVFILPVFPGIIVKQVQKEKFDPF